MWVALPIKSGRELHFNSKKSGQGPLKPMTEGCLEVKSNFLCRERSQALQSRVSLLSHFFMFNALVAMFYNGWVVYQSVWMRMAYAIVWFSCRTTSPPCSSWSSYKVQPRSYGHVWAGAVQGEYWSLELGLPNCKLYKHSLSCMDLLNPAWVWAWMIEEELRMDPEYCFGILTGHIYRKAYARSTFYVNE